MTANRLDAAFAVLSKQRAHLLRPRISDHAGEIVPALRFQLRGQGMIVVTAVVMHCQDRIPPPRHNRRKRPRLVIVVAVQIHALRLQVEIILRRQLGALRANVTQSGNRRLP